MNNKLYNIMRILAFPVVNICLMPHVINRKSLLIKHKCIVIANHTCYWDPVVLGYYVHPKNIYFMAKSELISHNKLIRNFLLAMGIIPVNRGTSDIRAVKNSMKVLKNDNVLGLFPEGERSKTGEMLPFKSGVAIMALKTNTPVLPIYLHNNGITPGKRTKVIVGEQFYLNEYVGDDNTNEAVDLANDVLMKKMLELKEILNHE